MTAKEISEIFTIWALNWPNAEMFQGGVKMLDFRCRIFATQLSDVDYWDGLLGAARSLRVRKYAPNIAEFSEDIAEAKRQMKNEIDSAYLSARNSIVFFHDAGESVEQIVSRLPERTQTVIRVMGGIDAFLPPDGQYFNMDGFTRTYEMLLRKRNMLTGEKFKPALPDGKNINETKNELTEGGTT